MLHGGHYTMLQDRFKIITSVFTLFLSCSFYTQNLIYNNSFEINKECPYRLSGLELVLGWKTPSKGTPDYFNQCSKDKAFLIPNNFVGNSFPHAGNAYIGFGYYFKEKHIEYIQTKLIEPLNANKSYCLEFFIKKASLYRFSFDELSILFSKEEFKWDNSEFYDDKVKEDNNLLVYKLPIQKKDEWTKVCLMYKPKTEEQYLTIGFNKPKDVFMLHMQARVVGSYYYLDDVSLIEIKDSNSNQCSCNIVNPIKKDSIKVEVVKSYYDSAYVKAFVLNNLVFESNKSKLLPVSNAELDKLVNYLKTNPTKTIELFGYTDNTGKELDNIKLSEARVKSVADYLISKGIETKRITFKGYGSKNPIKPNDTELNKAKNRRVEFKIK